MKPEPTAETERRFWSVASRSWSLRAARENFLFQPGHLTRDVPVGIQE